MLLKPITIAIADDHSLFRKTLKNYLGEQKNIMVAIEASNMLELFGKLKTSQIDILIMDVFMPGLNGDDALKILRNDYPLLKILVLSMSTDLNLMSDMLDLGIHGYISKAEEPDELILAIETVAAGRIYRNKLLTEALYWNKQHYIKSFGGRPELSLSEREKKILQLIWEEKNNKEIADELFLGIRSVEKIRQDMKEKMSVRSTVGMLKYALARKIIGVNLRNPV